MQPAYVCEIYFIWTNYYLHSYSRDYTREVDSAHLWCHPDLQVYRTAFCVCDTHLRHKNNDILEEKMAKLHVMGTPHWKGNPNIAFKVCCVFTYSWKGLTKYGTVTNTLICSCNVVIVCIPKSTDSIFDHSWVGEVRERITSLLPKDLRMLWCAEEGDLHKNTHMVKHTYMHTYTPHRHTHTHTSHRHTHDD